MKKIEEIGYKALNDAYNKDLGQEVANYAKQYAEFGATEQKAITKREMVEEILAWINSNKLPVNASETDDTIVGYSIMTDELIEYLKAMEE